MLLTAIGWPGSSASTARGSRVLPTTGTLLRPWRHAVRVRRLAVGPPDLRLPSPRVQAEADVVAEQAAATAAASLVTRLRTALIALRADGVGAHAAGAVGEALEVPPPVLPLS